MKRFIRIVSVFAAIVLAVTVIPAVVIDPYNVIHWKHLRNNGVEPNKSFIKTKYVVNHPEKFDAFLFGSSRVSAIHTNLIENEKVYNMTCSEGVPSDHLDIIRTFFDSGVGIRKVYIGVDSLSYTVDGRQHNNSPLRCSYSFLHGNPEAFLNLYCNPWLNAHSLYITYKNLNKESYNHFQFYNYGWHCDYNRKTSMDWSKEKPSVGACFLLDETLDDIREIKNYCASRQIETVFFTNPMYALTYRASLERDYFVFLRKLSSITDYYNFSGLNDITTDRRNYLDTSHYTAYVGDKIIGTIAFGEQYEGLYEQGFGRYINEENVEDLLRILSAQTAVSPT